FCIILGNLLENALEACERTRESSKFIQVNAQISGKRMILLTVKNSADKPIQKKQGSFLSSKREGVGTGIISVENLAEKYNGLVNFKYENGVFIASVFLNPYGLLGGELSTKEA
ncbi:MAG: ATP-binding protein, partial [Eubacterium sp.]